MARLETIDPGERWIAYWLIETDVVNTTASGLVYMYKGRIVDGAGVGTPHYAIKYDLTIRGGEIQPDSELWMGVLFVPSRIIPPSSSQIPLCEWFDDRPIPIIVGGHSKAGFRRAARYGAGWYGFQLSPEQTAGVIAELDAALAEAGRSRGADFQLIITPPYRVSTDMVKAYEDLGVDRLIVPAYLMARGDVRENCAMWSDKLGVA